MIGKILRTIFDWSEVWSLFIPLAVLMLRKPNSKWITPLKWYLLCALILNLTIDFYWYVNKYRLFGSRPGHNRWNNNIYYNLHSAARLLFFSWFFITQSISFKKIARIIIVAFLLFNMVLFSFFKNIFVISSFTLAAEAGLLLILCLLYTYKIINDKLPDLNKLYPSFWVIGGLTLYTSVNFFLFLFYNYLIKNYNKFSVNVWDLHNGLFILLCLSISIAFYYESKRK